MISHKSIEDFSDNYLDTIFKMLDALELLGWNTSYVSPTEYYAYRIYTEDANDYIEFGSVQGGETVGLVWMTGSGGDMFDIEFSLTDWKENVSKIVHAEREYRLKELKLNITDSYIRSLSPTKEMPKLLPWVNFN
jgi:hypothetical protein